MKKRALILALSSAVGAMLSFSGGLSARTLVLEGTIDDSLEITQGRSFAVPPGGLIKLTFRFALPVSFKNAALEQSLSNHRIGYDPAPRNVTTEKDSFGNTFTVVTWTDLDRDALVEESFDLTLKISLNDIRSLAPYPLGDIPADKAVFLRPTPLVQSEAPELKRLAAHLTEGAATEQAAVTSILNWVVDNIKYKTPIPNYDALWTLSAMHGNCQNFAHISMALLRASGIPARIAGGISLGKAWKVPLPDGALLQSIGQGGHAWMEVWYPDIGWVSYDAQQSHLFVGPRHIKQTDGLDSNDINDSWRASPILPRFHEDISAEYVRDSFDLRLRETLPGPANYIMATSVPKFAPAAAAVTEKPKKPEKPPEAATGVETEFGNMDFPSLMDFFVKSDGDRGIKTFDKETAEYVTGPDTYAQAFTISKTLTLETVSLAMHKFGGRLGSLWVDVVKDDGGRPGMEGVRSLPLSLDTVSYFPGYKWFDFRFYADPSDMPVLGPGRYWIVLRHSKDAVVNWFYIPGNQYGLPDDARSTATGIDWSNTLNLDFNFKLKGIFKSN